MNLRQIQDAIDERAIRTGHFPGGIVMNREDGWDVVHGMTSTRRVYTRETRQEHQYMELCGLPVTFADDIVPRGQLAMLTDREFLDALTTQSRDQYLRNVLNESGKWARCR